MKDMLLKNWGFKILALLLGFMIWFFVANVEDYSVSKTITGVPVMLLNQEAITDQNKVYEVIQGETVNIDIKGRRSVVEGLTADDFLATADLSELSITNAVQINVEALSIEVRREITVSVDEGVLMVAIEDRGEEKIPITVVTKGNPADGYAVIDTSTSPAAVTVVGSASLIKKIASIQAEIDVDEATGNLSVQSPLVLLDYYGEEISQDKLELSTSSVRVRAYIQKTKEVPIKIATVGEPAEGYAVAGNPQYEVETIMVAGTEEELKSLDSIEIDDIDVADRTSDLETNINLSDYLPAGITIIDKNTSLDIKIPIEKLVEKTLTLRSANISIEGRQDKYEYRIPAADNEFNITIVGLSADINDIKAEDLGAKVDVTGLNASGAYNISLQLEELPNIKYLDEASGLMVKIYLDEKTITTEEDASSEATSSSSTTSSTEATTESE